MDIEQLQQTLHEEQNSERLQQIPDTFYTQVATYIQNLREERDSLVEGHENVFNSPEAMELNQTLQRAEETFERIYNRRVGKLISQATLAVSGGTFDTEALTETEQDLYDSFTDTVNAHRTDALSVLENSTTPSTPNTNNTGTVADAAENADTPDTAETDDDITGDMADYMADGPETDTTDTTDTPSTNDNTPTKGDTHTDGFADDLAFGDTDQSDTPQETTDGGTPTDNNTDTESDSGTTDAEDFTKAFDDTDENSTDDDPELTTIHVLKDVGEVYGVDERTYNLTKDDVVSLPTENAEPLVMRDAAKPIAD